MFMNLTNCVTNQKWSLTPPPAGGDITSGADRLVLEQIGWDWSRYRLVLLRKARIGTGIRLILVRYMYCTAGWHLIGLTDIGSRNRLENRVVLQQISWNCSRRASIGAGGKDYIY
jgi:hypothetical protein